MLTGQRGGSRWKSGAAAQLWSRAPRHSVWSRPARSPTRRHVWFPSR